MGVQHVSRNDQYCLLLKLILLPIACCLTEKCAAYLPGNYELAEVGNEQGHDHNGGTVGHPLTRLTFFHWVFNS